MTTTTNAAATSIANTVANNERAKTGMIFTALFCHVQDMRRLNEPVTIDLINAGLNEAFAMLIAEGVIEKKPDSATVSNLRSIARGARALATHAPEGINSPLIVETALDTDARIRKSASALQAFITSARAKVCDESDGAFERSDVQSTAMYRDVCKQLAELGDLADAAVASGSDEAATIVRNVWRFLSADALEAWVRDQYANSAKAKKRAEEAETRRLNAVKDAEIAARAEAEAERLRNEETSDDAPETNEDAPDAPDAPETNEDAPDAPDAPETNEDAPEAPEADDAPETNEDAPDAPADNKTVTTHKVETRETTARKETGPQVQHAEHAVKREPAKTTAGETMTRGDAVCAIQDALFVLKKDYGLKPSDLRRVFDDALAASETMLSEYRRAEIQAENDRKANRDAELNGAIFQ